jgi:hypothetical protein
LILRLASRSLQNIPESADVHMALTSFDFEAMCRFVTEDRGVAAICRTQKSIFVGYPTILHSVSYVVNFT